MKRSKPATPSSAPGPAPTVSSTSTSFYETDRAVSEYLLAHFGDDDLALPWPGGPRNGLHFARRCVSECLGRDPLPPLTRALDLGCAVGAASFELARLGANVLGIDASARFIATAQRLLETREITFDIVLEGNLTQRAFARLPGGFETSQVRFEVGDALRLRPDLGDFDIVVAANLLDRVPRPRDLLAVLPTLVRPGGRLVLTSPYTWLTEYTPRDQWLSRGGQRTSELLPKLLDGLELVQRLDLPYLFREHARKFQWGVAEATVWHRH